MMMRLGFAPALLAAAGAATAASADDMGLVWEDWSEARPAGDGSAPL